MKAANHLQKKGNALNQVPGHISKDENIKDEIYRMMLFLNLIRDESLYQPDVPVISKDDKPGREGDPRIVCSNCFDTSIYN